MILLGDQKQGDNAIILSYYRRMTQKTRIRQVREDRGLSLRKVAEATGIPFTVLQRIETGNRGNRMREYVRTLAAFYDYEIDLADIYDPLFDHDVSRAL